MFESIRQDVRHAVRSLRRSPGLTCLVVLTLAVASGANTAVFSIFNQALLRELAVPAPDQLVNLLSPGPRFGRTSSSGTSGADAMFSYPLFRDLEQAQTVFTGLAAHRDFPANVAYKGQASSEAGRLVSGSFFPVLALQPALGRLLTPADDRARDAQYVVVLSHEYWRIRFNADPAILNDRLTVNGQVMTIVGVAPPTFTSTTLEDRPRIFVPLSMAVLMMPGARDPRLDRGVWNPFEDRGDHWLILFGRLKPGISRETAAATMNRAFTAILNDIELPRVPRVFGEAARDQFRNRRLILEPGAYGQRPERAELSRVLLFLFCVTAAVLAIACANIANLLLARAASRSAEMTVRLAIGANRARLVRYLLIESCLFAGTGALGGLIVAAWILAAISSLGPVQWAATDFGLDLTMLSFTTAVSAAMALLVGLYPALHSTRRDLTSALKSNTTTSAPRAVARFRMTLATVQIALSMALLIIAGLFARSLLNMSRVELGIDASRLLTFRVSPERNGYAPERIGALFDRIADELLATPGVTGVSVSTVPLLAGMASGTNITVEGFHPPPGTYMGTVFSRIGTHYFRTLGIPLIAGREFSDTDGIGSPKVAIVNEAFVRRFNLGASPIGKRIHLGAGGPLDIEIVGLVKDASYSQLKDPPPSQFFLPYRQQAPPAGELNFYVRSSVPPERIVSMIRPLVARIDGTLPVENLQLMTTQALATVALDRLIAALSAGFAALATFLAAIGLFGVLSYTVMQQTREIGIRIALGADVGRVQGMVLGQVGRMTVVGGIAGVAAALGLARLARSMLFEVEGVDPVVMAWAAAGAAVVAIGAGMIPARRAAHVDPIAALRAE